MRDCPRVRFLKDRQGHSIAYAEHGQGPLVICPAWWVSHVEKDWAHPSFRQFFEQLGRGLRIVRYDRPGVGLSDRDVHNRTLDDEVELLADVAASFDEENYALFAISCGGPIAIRHAADNPGKVSRICFSGSFVDGTKICSLEVRDAVISIVRAHWGLGSRAMADIFLPDANGETLDAYARQTRDAASAEAAEELLRLTYAMEARDAIANVDAECLVIHRRGDRAIPFEVGRRLASLLPEAHLLTLEGRAHPPWYEGDEIAEAANAFFLGRAQSATEQQPVSAKSTSCIFDEANRQLVLEGKPVALTPLEFSVMRELIAARGSVVTRDELLERVWNQSFEGSNKIDAVISALRRKLKRWSASIETVTGHGYRFSEWQQKQ